MAWCDKQFGQWSEDIKLTKEQADRVNSAFTRFRDFCTQNSQLKAAMDGLPFYQGSAATRTIVRPLSDGEFDVDIVFPFSVLRLGKADSRSVLEWFKLQVNADSFYKKHRIEKDRCVRIDYAGEFHVDFIPATAEIQQHQPYAIPAKDLKDWIRTNPLGFRDWVNAVDQRSQFVDKYGDGAFIRAIRYAKRWRDHTFKPESAPSSMLLVTMMGRHDPSHHNYSPPLTDPLYPEYKHDCVYLYDMMRLTHSCLLTDRVTSSTNPLDADEDLGHDWKAKDRETFINTLGACCEKLREAIYSDSEAKAIGLFRSALGNTFPN